MNIIFATHNPNKTKEIKNQLGDNFTVQSLSDIGFTDEIKETANTLEGNALLKVRAIHQKTGKNCFADDTGLEVEVLNGAPGVYSARYAGDHCNAEDNMDKLLSALKEAKNRTARFRTVVALILNGKEYTFEGICEGEILPEQTGEEGFGYDPIFKPKGYDRSFAQMSLNDKNEISHRGLAVKKLINFLKAQS
jgi:XTP/dITP diphosphohydrolase